MAVSQFQTYLDAQGLDITILESIEPTKTAQQAADVHGVPVAAIVKSILLKVDDRFVLFLVPGDRRLDLNQITREQQADTVRMATPEEVKQVTGYSIGGVPPFGHQQPITTIISEGFDPNGTVVPAAGAGNAVFKIPYGELQRIIAGS